MHLFFELGLFDSTLQEFAESGKYHTLGDDYDAWTLRNMFFDFLVERFGFGLYMII